MQILKYSVELLIIHEFKKFLARQVTQIRQGGTKVFFNKVLILIWIVIRLFFNLISLPFVLLIRLLHPVIKVRFIKLDAGRIGHFDMAHIYWARKENGEFDSDIFDIVYFHVSRDYTVANVQYLKMWRRTLITTPMFFSYFLASIQKMNEILPGKKSIYYGDRIDQEFHNINYRITESILRHVGPPISFTSDEDILGKNLLLELGIPEKKQFICFHSRDNRYLETFKFKRDWSYHDFRNSNIYNYLPAAEEMTKSGYYAIRMGSQVKESFEVDNPQIIDYASNGNHSDFLDIYLLANCRLLIISDTGLSNPPEVFRKPIVYVNDFLYALLYRLSVQDCIFIFKKYYLIREKRFLTYAEIAKSNLLFCGLGFEFKKRGIEVVENTQEEIIAATIEMEERLLETWVTKKEDEELQKQFWSLLPKYVLKSPNCRIGTQFLRDNRELFIPL